LFASNGLLKKIGLLSTQSILILIFAQKTNSFNLDVGGLVFWPFQVDLNHIKVNDNRFACSIVIGVNSSTIAAVDVIGKSLNLMYKVFF
jgi:hypothetical protein